jgi:hypothetical protein
MLAFPALLGWIVVTVSGANPHLERARAQLERLDERGALATLAEAKAWRGNSPHELALVYLYTGFAQAGLANLAAAREAFGTALLLDSTLSLGPEHSPRVRELWVKAGGKVTLPKPELPPGAVPTAEAGAAPATSSVQRWAGLGLVAASAGALVAGLVVGARAQGAFERATAAGDVDGTLSQHQAAVGGARLANGLYAASLTLGVAGVAVLVW